MIMDCDLGRLRVAIDAARERIGAERRHTMRLHGFKVEDPPEPDQSDDEITERMRGFMARFRRRETHDDDD